VSLLVALEDPAPTGPLVAPPAVVAEASPDLGPCELSRAPLGLVVSLLTAPPVAAPAAAASPELLTCASANVGLSIRKEKRTNLSSSWASGPTADCHRLKQSKSGAADTANRSPLPAASPWPDGAADLNQRPNARGVSDPSVGM
jgi:hypothetical protein